MTLAMFDEVATFDDEGRVDGFQFNSRERRIQEWKEKKENDEFEKMITKLRRHKNYRAWYERHKDDPVWRERLRTYTREQRRKHSAKRNADARKKRIESHASIVNVCEECGTQFSFEYGKSKKKRSRFCSMKCRNRTNDRLRVRLPKNPPRAMSFEAIEQYLRDHPRSSINSVCEATGVLRATVYSALIVACKKGIVIREGVRDALYSLAS
jgi:hypothetical protein